MAALDRARRHAARPGALRGWDEPSHVYFPTTSIVSLLYVLQDGGSAEIAIVGFDGLVGISLFMGGESTPNRGVVLDRLVGPQLNMKQELISNMPGVRREGVTEAALKLCQAQLIRYARGKIVVLDRARFEERACEYCAVVKKEIRPASASDDRDPRSTLRRRSASGLAIADRP